MCCKRRTWCTNPCLQPSTSRWTMCASWTSLGWERIDLDISLYWSILMFTCAGKFFLFKQAELIEPVEWASLNSFLLSSVSSSDAFWCATHSAEVKKVKWRWEHFIHNFYELFRPTVSLPLGNICFLIAVQKIFSTSRQSLLSNTDQLSHFVMWHQVG